MSTPKPYRTILFGDSIVGRIPSDGYLDIYSIGGYSVFQALTDTALGKHDHRLQHQECICILIGTNDILLTFPHNVVTAIISLAQIISARFRQTKVYICSILPRCDRQGKVCQPGIKLVNKLLERILERIGLPFINLVQPFLYAGEVCCDYL